jgi:hypothetical protein
LLDNKNQVAIFEDNYEQESLELHYSNHDGFHLQDSLLVYFDDKDVKELVSATIANLNKTYEYHCDEYKRNHM